MIVLLIVVLVLLGVSILLFRRDVFADEDARLLSLFAVAGALGGALRSFAYSLALHSFTERERGQWRTEALVAPVVGAVAGLVAYLIVRAALVTQSGEINREGQYLVSLLAGALALRPLGTIVERGVIRGSMSRSGILGGEVSPTVPLLDRIDRLLEQRISEDTLTNYDGWVAVTASRAAGKWLLTVRFSPNEPPGPEAGTRIKVVGGEDREVAIFNVSASSDDWVVSPIVLTVSVPRLADSEPGTILLGELSAHEAAADQSASAADSVILEIGQGTQTLQAVLVPLPG